MPYIWLYLCEMERSNCAMFGKDPYIILFEMTQTDLVCFFFASLDPSKFWGVNEEHVIWKQKQLLFDGEGRGVWRATKSNEAYIWHPTNETK